MKADLLTQLLTRSSPTARANNWDEDDLNPIDREIREHGIRKASARMLMRKDPKALAKYLSPEQIDLIRLVANGPDEPTQ
jgi:hypothetical protein